MRIEQANLKKIIKKDYTNCSRNLKMNIKKNYDYFLARIDIGLKQNKEYKINFYSSLINDIGVIFTSFIFYTVYSSLIGDDLLNWNTYDYFVYVLLAMGASKFHRLFGFHQLRRILLRGTLNMALVRPIHPYIFFLFTSFSGFRLVSYPITYITLIISIIFGDYSNYFFALIIYIYGILYYAIAYSVIYGTAFFIKENSSFIMIYESMQGVISRFTPKLFQEGFLFHIAILFPMSIASFLTINILKGNFLLLDYLYHSFIIFIVLVIINIMQWHYGLKKYEAFG
jgi:ABC-type uncharacterized transport system permease subunit